jgi:exodeoxyribonuclease V alpha subunit
MQAEIPLSRLDSAFANFLLKHCQLVDEAEKKELALIVAELSYRQSQGHSCLLLDTKKCSLVLASGLVDNLGKKPLVLEGNLLYLQRYWEYEVQLVNSIQQLLSQDKLIKVPEELLDKYFPQEDILEIDWQRKAAQLSVSHSFSMITGGPGTGKTTTVIKILALLQELSSPTILNIALIAPTGKAAMRLQESIRQSKRYLVSSDKLKKCIPEEVVTIHRLLGASQFSPYFKYNKYSSLAFDVVVVDEVSMIDLALMSKLLSALKLGARLILLGDRDQLASVEAGSVLADLTAALPMSTQELKKSYRFERRIKELALTINEQKGVEAWNILANSDTDVGLLKDELIGYIVQKQLTYLKLIEKNVDFIDVHQAFNAFQVLCVTRRGILSIEDINSRVVKKLRGMKKIKGRGEWYIGRPVLITQNDATLGLYNGDIGICLFDSENQGRLVVGFLLSDGTLKKYLPARLPDCETVFAMTIHKSQGSEFEEVLLILPEKVNPILTKELIYTGVTRAKKKVRLFSNKNIFLAAVKNNVSRESALALRLSDNSEK